MKTLTSDEHKEDFARMWLRLDNFQREIIDTALHTAEKKKEEAIIETIKKTNPVISGAGSSIEQYGADKMKTVILEAITSINK